MTNESHPAGEFLHARQFVQRSLERLGAARVAELDPRDKALIALAFQIDQSDADESRARHLNLGKDQTEEVWRLLGERGAQMLILFEALTVGFDGSYQGLDVGPLLAR